MTSSRKFSLNRLFQVTFLVASFAFAGGAVAGALDDIKQRGYMIVVTEDNYPPLNFIQDGRPAGLNHDLYQLLKEWAPFEVRQKILPFQGLLTGIVTGEFDVALTAVTVTDQRAHQLDFTMPISEATYYYVKRKGDDRIKSFEDLSGLTLGTQQGSAMQQRLPEVDKRLQMVGGELGPAVFYTSYPEAYQDLAVGRVDYVINSVIPLSDLVRKRPNEFELGEQVDQATYQSWAVKKGNKDLLDFLNRFLAEQRNNGTMAKLQEKWFGRSFPNMPSTAMLPGNRPIAD